MPATSADRPAFDLGPAARTLAALVAGVTDDRLDDPTPCSDWTVGGLLAHVHQFASVFTTNARKQPPEPPTTLVADWRTAVPDQLVELARAWADDTAWHGRASAGGVEMSAADNAVVAGEELTVHGWDLAVSTGQSFTPEPPMLDQVERFLTIFPAERVFGPPLTPEQPTDDRFAALLRRTGRDPGWRPDRPTGSRKTP
ncbi:uncharacterized protein (TIGR03086 family) [Friedmanniella endophytica]|uniref:Uncharacterized protein (TIGR03086 family) n=1 Tax=Microlunatus kandeliicorticis TaxID=1759536 RepID=A0A7W3ITM2_9ACTN|nr:TIGR03086 family metal-binding protein [Microlunatus kandeliicorticis]MBA8795041.1 uncharacterized protein (TIGR03086 family) [Microlunatus kandeliicorticis]